jgi:hypothetical protein
MEILDLVLWEGGFFDFGCGVLFWMFDNDGVYTQEYCESQGFSPFLEDIVPDESEVLAFDAVNPLKGVLEVYGGDSVREFEKGVLYGDIEALKASVKLLRCKNKCFVVIRGVDIGTIRCDRRRKPVSDMVVDSGTVGGLVCSEVMKILG